MQYALEDLPKINKYQINKFVILNGLKTEHASIVNRIINDLVHDENIEQITDFKSWSNDYVAHLVTPIIYKDINTYDEVLDDYKNDYRQRNNLNNLKTIKFEIDSLFNVGTYRLVTAQSIKTNYVLSADAQQYLVKFDDLHRKFSLLVGKIKKAR